MPRGQDEVSFLHQLTTPLDLNFQRPLSKQRENTKEAKEGQSKMTDVLGLLSFSFSISVNIEEQDVSRLLFSSHQYLALGVLLFANKIPDIIAFLILRCLKLKFAQNLHTFEMEKSK